MHAEGLTICMNEMFGAGGHPTPAAIRTVVLAGRRPSVNASHQSSSPSPSPCMWNNTVLTETMCKLTVSQPQRKARWMGEGVIRVGRPWSRKALWGKWVWAQLLLRWSPGRGHEHWMKKEWQGQRPRNGKKNHFLKNKNYDECSWKHKLGNRKGVEKHEPKKCIQTSSSGRPLSNISASFKAWTCIRPW